MRGQGLVEFAVITPLLLLFVFGIIEVGRLLAIYSGASSAAQQTARYGSVAGDTGQGSVFYLDCAGMRTTAKRTAFLYGLTDSEIQISYDTGHITDTVGTCGADNVPRFTSDGAPMTDVNSRSLISSGRVVVSIDATYKPILPLVPIPDLPMNFMAARTIFTSIAGPANTPVPPPDLALSIAQFPDPVAPGSTLTYTLDVTNTGPSVATSVTVVDQLPTEPTFLSVSGDDWACGRVQSVVTCTLSSLAIGPAPEINILMTAQATGGTITNTATVTSSRGDANPANNQASEQTVVAQAADLSLSLADAPDPVAPNGTLTYTLDVANNSTVTASSVSVTAQLPGSVVFVSISGSGWACNTAGSTVTCTRASLAAGAAPAIAIVVTAPGSHAALTATASVTSATTDLNTANNTASADTTVASDADLSLTQTDSPDPAGLGDPVTYVLHVTNNGPNPANSVTLTDTLPTGTAFVSASGAGWTCSQGGGAVTCTQASLAPGAASDVTLVVNAPASSATLINRAGVTSTTADSNAGNNASEETTNVLSCNPNVVNAGHSLVTASPAVAQADGADAAEVVVTLRDNCGNLLAGRPVSLTSSQGALDTITPASGTTNAVGQFTFRATSYTVSGGVPSVFTATSGSTTLTQTASATFVCVSGAVAPFSGSQDLKFSFTNNTGLNRRLVSVTLTWPGSGSRKMISINFGTDQIWSGNGNNSPLTINGGWAAGSRVINTGTNKTLQLNFNFALSGTGQYQLSTQWDDTAGSSICTAPTIIVTR
jgi:uncharacterized repeat protein (TIGR01451 family)